VGLASIRFGCGIEMCGACSLLVDGKVTRLCTINVSEVIGKTIVTKEGLPADHPLVSSQNGAENT